MVKGNLKSVNAARSQGSLFLYYFWANRESTANDGVWFHSPKTASRRGPWSISRGTGVPRGLSRAETLGTVSAGVGRVYLWASGFHLVAFLPAQVDWAARNAVVLQER